MTSIELLFYKNHEKLTLTPEEAEILYREAEPLTIVKDALRRHPTLDSKYPGYVAWVITHAEDSIGLGIIPCEGIVIIRDDGGVHHYDFQHSIARPESEDFAKLPPVVWHQLGTKGASTIYLLHLVRNPRFNTALCSDERTGKPYPYMLSRVIALHKT